MVKDIDSAVKWYKENQSLYTSLSSKVADIIKENLEQSGIQYHSVTSRGKSLESFTNKAKSEKYSDPTNEIKDMAGIRVITYLETDVQKVVEVIEKLFDIDKTNSIDQSQLLGSDKLGYRSVHYVAKFTKSRCKLPEYKKYEDLPFEIQVRSILQHAWAEIEHDRNYKFSGKLPTQLERRFYLVAGMLECADREFVAIGEEIDKYKNTVVEELRKGDLDIDINTASLKEYLSGKFNKLIEQGLLRKEFGEGDVGGKVIVEEAQLFGISKLYQLDKVIPQDFQDNMLGLGLQSNFSGIMRVILMISGLKRYFEVSWRKDWQALSSSSLELLKRYNVDIKYLRKYVNI
ncbi:MAG: hypothetical protein E3J75_03185 [Dehalococcoidia bacterium]|nr:MAG: hypothetical protein E3J75_03185 [Dehalococcoidia bacterium]